MSESIALCVNFYNDVRALRGLLESGSRFFDRAYCINAGPNGDKSTDGSIELCEQFGAKVDYADINDGFGVVRTRLIHECGCSFAFILDADERFYPQLPVIHCEGTERWLPHEGNIPHRVNLSVFHRPEVCNQGQLIRNLIENKELLAIKSIRRHWLDYSMRHPTENWLLIRDFQLRIVRSCGEIGYERGRKMHERLIDYRTNDAPTHFNPDQYSGPFHDHFHCFYRKVHPGTKEWNEANYGRLDRGEPLVSAPKQ